MTLSVTEVTASAVNKNGVLSTWPLYTVTGGQAILDNSRSTAPTRPLLRISRKYHFRYSFYHLQIFNYDISVENIQSHGAGTFRKY